MVGTNVSSEDVKLSRMFVINCVFGLPYFGLAKLGLLLAA